MAVGGGAHICLVRKRGRLCRDYEELPEHHEGFIYMAMIRLLLQKLSGDQRTRSAVTLV